MVWIVGGLLKGVDISSLIERHKTSLAAAIVIGADRVAVLEALAENAPGVPVVEITEESGSEVMVAAVKAAGVPVLAYGSFISVLINFIILAFIIFMMVRQVSKLTKALIKEEEAAPAAPAPTPEDILLLREIRDSLKK